MSYDLRAFAPSPGEDPLQTAHSIFEREEEIPSPASRNPEAEAKKKALTEALTRHNPQLSPFQLQYEDIAKLQQITIEEAKAQYRYIELNGPEDGNGIQITLHDTEASITVPYWHERPQADVVFQEIWGYLRILQESGGYCIYDPQLERILDLNNDFEDVVRCYTAITGNLHRSCATEPPSPDTKKPWWKFW
ncbi:MAG: hypothetical protein ACM359_23795 [Bacillota bacterium]